jgi:DNA-binding NarL/FixJ family response regulator
MVPSLPKLPAEGSLQAKLRVFLVDDHPVVRDGFSRVIAEEPDLEVVGGAGTAEEALAAVAAASPDVVLVDLHLPDRDGPDLIAALGVLLPAAKLVVVSSYDDEYRVAEALRAGAHGYLLKSSPVSELIVGIRTAAAGGTPLSPSLSGAILRAMRRTGKSGPGALDTLTPRELQVLRLFASGQSTSGVASSLGISPKTVETHRIRIYEKLGCRSMVELTRFAVRSGLIEA